MSGDVAEWAAVEVRNFGVSLWEAVLSLPDRFYALDVRFTSREQCEAFIRDHLSGPSPATHYVIPKDALGQLVLDALRAASRPHVAALDARSAAWLAADVVRAIEEASRCKDGET